ncbi:hypothetical protein TEA_004487 [Camellia sinensis var. sinensis]|uniref:Methyltransferase FkbM domain-containing protein n=1 Tax=Camellia sinensis var. sinensis TaxID=542762 RepID=A0A4S4EC11_CAMSN|nr:hypothetical protein TEA_004487 [Camellia sinensis var. sinensis]
MEGTRWYSYEAVIGGGIAFSLPQLLSPNAVVKLFSLTFIDMGILFEPLDSFLVGRLDNSAVSATGAKMAFKSNEEIALQVRSIPLDEVIQDSQPVLLLKIDVQGWEYHVLKGASRLLSRKKDEAPYIIYEEDERLLQASNSSAKEIREFLHSVGYDDCTQHEIANSIIEEIRKRATIWHQIPGDVERASGYKSKGVKAFPLKWGLKTILSVFDEFETMMKDKSSRPTMKINTSKDGGRIKHFTGDLKQQDNEMGHDESLTPIIEINIGKDRCQMKPLPTMEIKTDEDGLCYSLL